METAPDDNTWLYQDPIAEITALKRKLVLQGIDLVDLSMFNPDILPSAVALDALHEYSLKASNHRYAVSRGIRKLREAFAFLYAKKFSVTLDPESEICVCSGTKDGLIHVLHALVSPGDTVVVATPTYPMHVSAIKLARAQPAYFDITNGTEDQIISRLIEVLDQTKAKIVLLNFPNNPTGISVSDSFLKMLAQVTVERGVTVINDFVYGEMMHRTANSGLLPSSLLTVRNINPNVLESYSLSKAYSVPGWRTGAILGNTTIVRSVARLKSHSDYGIFLPLQHAAAAVLTSPLELASAITGQYERRLRVLMTGLTELGWSFSRPTAGACLWARLPEGLRSYGAAQVCRSLLEHHHLLITPGELYGSGFEEFVRFALVVSEEKIHDVVGKIKEFQTTCGH